jgi:hypothetical protein
VSFIVLGRPPQVVACTGAVLVMLPPFGPAQPVSDVPGRVTDQGRVEVVVSWRGDLGNAETPLPDERLDLVWVDDGSLWLSGPETTLWSRGYPPGTTAVGVGFKPAVGPPMLDLAASEVRDARIRLEELWGDRDARELAERVAVHPDDRGRARELERAVRRLAARGRPVDEVALEVAARLNQPRAASAFPRSVILGGSRCARSARSWRGCWDSGGEGSEPRVAGRHGRRYCGVRRSSPVAVRA